MNNLPDDIKNIVVQYKKALETTIHVDKMYVYGSYAKGNYHKDSDIDICVVTHDKFKKKDLWRILSKKTHNIDLRIEPVGYTYDRFVDEVPLVWEVKQHGILI